MRNLFDLTNRKAIITGGAGDIGFEITKLLNTYGAKTVIIDKDINTLTKAHSLNTDNLTSSYGVIADLRLTSSIRDSFSKAQTILNGLDILVNCAGIIRREDAEKIALEEWNEVIEINLNTTFLFCQLAAKIMLKQKYGRIINTGSMNSFDGGVRVASYSASKGAVALLTKALSNEWSGKGINVNAIAPGYIATQINTFYRTPEGADRNRDITNRIPIGRWGKPEDIAGAALFLASDAADYISGIVLPVDGGYQGY
jgi:2-deoxy-D-gluconate 3-dehydrogenase